MTKIPSKQLPAWIDKRTADISASLRCLLLGLLSFVLIACGGSSGGNSDGTGDQQDRTISAQPVSVVLRPGEIDDVQLTESTVGLGASSDIFAAQIVSGLARPPCVIPDPQCSVFTLTPGARAATNDFEVIEFSKTDFFDPLALNNRNKSTLPVTLFPAATEMSAPIVRFDANGPGDSFDDTVHNSDRFFTSAGHSLAVDADGIIWAWGENENGQLGDGSNKKRSMPVQVQTAVLFKEVKAGFEHSLAIAEDGTVWAWGDNSNGQLGVGTQNNSATPVQVQNLTDVVAIAAGAEHSLALRSDGTVWGWGNSLGLTSGTSLSPVQIIDLENIIAIAAGDYHSLALRSDNIVFAWGDNNFGQVGDGTVDVISVRTPQQVDVITSVDGIAAGEGFSIAVLSNGTVWTWGLNRTNQLGGTSSSNTCGRFDNLACSPTPQRVAGLDQILNVAAGGGFSLARRSDGTVWAWGDNRYGQLGGLPGLGSLTPIQAPGLTNILSIAAGLEHGLALSSDQACSVGNGRVGGRLMAWGNNQLGTRGDGTAVNWLRPTPVLTLGDSAQCDAVMGNRLFVYKGGTGTGTVQSDQAGLTCTGNICWQAVAPGTNVTLSATADANSEPGDWRWDCPNTTPTSTVTMDSVKHCKVVFNAVAPVVAACADGIDNDDDGLIDLADPGCENAADESEVNVLTPSAACADGLDNDDDGLIDLADPGCTDSNDDSELDPVLPGQVRLTVTILGGPGAGEVRSAENPIPTLQCINSAEAQTSCVADFPVNSAVLLLPSPFGSNTLITWQGCGAVSGSLECQLDMNAARSVSVTFATPPASFPLDVSVLVDGQPASAASPGGRVTSDPIGINCGSPGAGCSATYTTGTFVALTAAELPGFNFSRWSSTDSGSGCDGSTNLTVTVAMTRARQCNAEFATEGPNPSLVVTPTVDGVSPTALIWGGVVISTPAGISCGNPGNINQLDCSENYSIGTTSSTYRQSGRGISIHRVEWLLNQLHFVNQHRCGCEYRVCALICIRADQCHQSIDH